MTVLISPFDIGCSDFSFQYKDIPVLHTQFNAIFSQQITEESEKNKIFALMPIVRCLNFLFDSVCKKCNVSVLKHSLCRHPQRAGGWGVQGSLTQNGHASLDTVSHTGK